MRRLTHSTAAKVVAIILFVIFATTTVLSFGCFSFSLDKGFYFGDVNNFYDTDWCVDITASNATTVYEYYYNLLKVRTENDLQNDFTEGKYDDLGIIPDSYVNYLKKQLSDINFRYEVIRSDGTPLFANYNGEKYGYTASYNYDLYYEGERIETYDKIEGAYYEEYINGYDEMIVVNCYVLDPLQYDDAYMHYNSIFLFLRQFSTIWIVLFFVSLIVAVLMFVFLLNAAGHHKGCEAIVPNRMDKIPFDLYIVIMGIALILLLLFIDDHSLMPFNSLVFTCFAGVVLMVFLLMLSMTVATRLKLKSIFKNTVIYRIGVRFGVKTVRWLRELFRSIPFIWKGVLVLIGIMIVEVFFYICALSEMYLFAPLCIGFHIGLLVVGLILLTNMQRLRESGTRLAEGNIAYHTDENGLMWEFKQHAKNLNSISDGMSRAVELRMQSERMKTELITNVSHDIKTPLTSIINYVDLLKKEDIVGGKAREYLEVLDRQSERLKKLIVDLVDASKASTGNITAELMPMAVGEVLCQAVVEYNDKMEKSGLSAVMHCDEKLRVMADGRLVWRILDNLLGNACKYSKDGTRVYIDAVPEDKFCKITIKNISRDQLNIDPNELMERFVRADSSRSSEGSGLGLSIAKSLSELMGGSLGITIDGDLFKVELRLPLVG